MLGAFFSGAFVVGVGVVLGCAGTGMTGAFSTTFGGSATGASAFCVSAFGVGAFGTLTFTPSSEPMAGATVALELSPGPATSSNIFSGGFVSGRNEYAIRKQIPTTTACS